MIKEYNLSVLFTDDLLTSGTITRISDLRVDVNNLSVTKVTELKAKFGVRIRSEVSRIVEVSGGRIPVEEAQVTGLGKKQFLLHEDFTEVLSLHSICKVDVTADLVASTLVDSNENDGSHTAVTESFFSLSESHQESVSFDRASSVS